MDPKSENNFNQQNYLFTESALNPDLSKQEELAEADNRWRVFIKEEPLESHNIQISESCYDSVDVKKESVGGEEIFTTGTHSILQRSFHENQTSGTDSVDNIQNHIEIASSSLSENKKEMIGDESSGITAENKELYECNSCVYKTFRKFDFKRHLLIHSTTKLFKCPECDYECNLKSLLQRHSLTHSDREKLFKCSQCQYETNYKNHFKRHSLSHAETKLFKCPKCMYETNHSRDFKTHLLNHSNIKAFKCTECDYATNRNKDLRTHMLRHSETKLFKCEECGYETNYKQHFKNHLSSHEDIQIYSI